MLLSGEEETDITDYFIETAFPTRDEVQHVLDALERAPGGLSLPELLGAGEPQLRADREDAAAPLSGVAGADRRQGSRWQLTAADLSEAFWQRAERLTTLRRAEQRHMQEYVTLSSAAYGVSHSGAGWTARHPPLSRLASPPGDRTPGLVHEAVAFLRRASLLLEPRKQWPAGGLPQFRLTGRIPPERQAQPGKALCVWGDAGWGDLVRRGKYRDGRFADELVDASAALVRAWAPQPPPVWVTCVPSRRHPDLVPDFARRLASALNLRFHAVLEKTDDRPEQKTHGQQCPAGPQHRRVPGQYGLSWCWVGRSFWSTTWWTPAGP